MLKLNLMLAAAVVGAGMGATTNIAMASNYILNPADCVSPSAAPLRWYSSSYPNYFVSNWEPFFRRHIYFYGPILTCAAPPTAPMTVAPPIISTKY
jgi:hypothetical protein